MSRETSAQNEIKFGLKFLSSVFLIGAFFGKYGFRLVRWKCRVFVKIGKNKSSMPPEFCLSVIGGKEMLLYLIGHREQSQDLLCVCKGDSRSAQKATKAE